MNVLTIAIYDDASLEPIWTIIPTSFVDMGGQVIGGTSRRQSLDDPRVDENTEDDNLRTIAQAAGVFLSEFSYGVTPNGFRQLIPDTGAPPLLKEGARHIVVLKGEASARLTFEGRGSTP